MESNSEGVLDEGDDLTEFRGRVIDLVNLIKIPTSLLLLSCLIKPLFWWCAVTEKNVLSFSNVIVFLIFHVSGTG
jgi:hypothetical protein